MPNDEPDDSGEVLAQITRCGALTCAAWSEDGEATVPEMRLLRDLWRVADPGERAALAAAMARAFARDDEWW